MSNILRHLTIFCIFAATFADSSFPEVKINQGVLRGKLRQTWNGRTFSAFTGIPYAKPPIGNLRFKPAVPAEPWSGILDASKSHPICPQLDVYLNETTIKGDEDCLYLNVYTSQEFGSNFKSKSLPVMFFIHGGGFFSGSANPELYGPDILLDKDIVLVTTNYRLGALGFLSTEDEVLPGNNGLKDQNLALKWVKQNIAYFGGDPNKITIFGQSAGGASTHFHLLSPLSKDLISGAIAHSGVSIATWALAQRGHAAKNAKKLAELLGCPTTSSQKIVECLSNFKAYDIVEQEQKFLVYSYDPMVPFKPVIEPDIGGAFLAEHPIEIVKSGKSADIPFMTGMTTEEGAIKAAALYNDSRLIEELNRDFDRLAPIILQYDETAPNKNEITEKIRSFYFGNRNIDYSTKSELADMFTDAWGLSPANAVVQLHAKYSKQPVYYYMFGYRGPVSFSTLFGDSNHNYGVCHCDELLYLLSSDLFQDHKPSASDKKIADIMTTMWANFAATGNPTPKTDSVIKTAWKPVPADTLSYYFIKDENHIEMANDLYHERAEFWRNLIINPTSTKIKDEL